MLISFKYEFSIFKWKLKIYLYHQTWIHLKTHQDAHLKIIQKITQGLQNICRNMEF